MDCVDLDDVRAFAARRWDLLEQETDGWRAERFRTQGAASTMAASVALRERYWRIHGRPTSARRQSDLAHHVALKRKLDRVRRVVEDR